MRIPFTEAWVAGLALGGVECQLRARADPRDGGLSDHPLQTTFLEEQ